MRLSSPVAKRKARIEIIPLIDIVFFLLATFVMVSLSMVKNDGLPVRLPGAATSSAEDRRSAVTLTVTETGEVHLDKEKMTVGVMKTRLAAMKENDPDLKVLINGDRRSEFGLAVEVLDEVRSVGIQKVSIQTQKKT